MHELSIAATIVESVLEFVEARQIGRVLRVRLAIGELTCVQPEQLKFCYESVTQETALKDSALEIESIPARVRCSSCAYEGAPKYWMESLADTPVATLQCPVCGKSTEAEQGHECAIKTIQYVS
ncbi:MAG TPA: hydrogenase maturation nickel metallochaperone HypA [Verrucomicrobiae bacterium]|jgi:hydrogenase nickel incorporation protein HypA/HybF|nr:hydrogenase maturation nickel metallochaperone HypA [Verrucomicrobiae bacterium]